MADWFHLAALVLLATVAVALVRCWRGPGRIDRIMAAQLAGTGAIGVAVVLGAARGDAAMLDAALIGAALAAVTVAAFARTRAGSDEDGADDAAGPPK